jgi:hypothetical protein
MSKFKLSIEGEAGIGMNYQIDGIHKDLVNAIVGVMHASEEWEKAVLHSAKVYEKIQESKGDVSGDLGGSPASE